MKLIKEVLTFIYI